MADKKLRIAMIGQKHTLSREGGVEVVVRELAVRMAARGHEVTCFDRRGRHVSGSELDERREYNGVRIKPVWTIEKKGLAAATSSLAGAILASLGKYDVVHIHAEGPAAVCWIPHLFHKRVIVTIHGLDWARAKWGGFAAGYIKWGERQAVRRADEIIVLSRNHREYFKKTYGRNTVYIPNGISVPSVVPAAEITRQWGLEKDSYVLFVGRIVPEKGLDCLLSAWKEIRTDKKLVIVGGSSDTQTYMDTLRASAGERVVFTGFQQGRALEELYSNACIYVLPSDLEGMPLSLLEAMSYGNCCVVSDIPECADVVGDKAVVFPRGNAEALKNVLQRLLDHPEEANRYRAGASDYICGKYGWDEAVDRTLELYQK